MQTYLIVHQALPFSKLLISQLPFPLSLPLLLSVSHLLSLQGSQFLPLLLQAALLLLFDEWARPWAGPRKRRAGGGALTQGLSLFLYEAILLNHHRLRRDAQQTNGQTLQSRTMFSPSVKEYSSWYLSHCFTKAVTNKNDLQSFNFLCSYIALIYSIIGVDWKPVYLQSAEEEM